MVWVIVVVAVVVLALAAWVGTGKLGEMPEVVNDRPKSHIPEGEFNAEFLLGLKLPLASTGYDPAQVDTYLDEVVAGTAIPASEVRFNTVRRGYDMQAVDAVLDRVPGAHEARRAFDEEPVRSVDEVDEGDVDGALEEDGRQAPAATFDETPERSVDEVLDEGEIDVEAPAPARSEEA